MDDPVMAERKLWETQIRSELIRSGLEPDDGAGMDDVRRLVDKIEQLHATNEYLLDQKEQIRFQKRANRERLAERKKLSGFARLGMDIGLIE